jgi:hypothetical protein
LLDGSHLPIPDNTEGENMGVWSEYASNSNGVFEDAFPLVRLIADEYYSSEGLTLNFDTQNNVYPTDLVLYWYKGDELIVSKEYAPSSPVFSVYENVSEFDRIDILFRAMNTPYSRLRFQSIRYGSLLIIEEKHIKNMRVSQEVSPISTTLPISTADISFLNYSNANYNFSARESLKIFDNGALIGIYFIESAKQVTKQQWNIRAQDYMALLESTEFEGGIYVNAYAENILTDIFNRAGVPFSIAENLKQAVVSGYIPFTTCRGALQQVLFAIGAYANTAYSMAVDIVESDLTITESIPAERIFTGQSVTLEADITEIELIGHNYSPSQSEVVLHEASEVEEEIRVIFNEPIHDLSIENGEILERGANYAIISCTENGVLKGKKYEHLTFSKSRVNTNTFNKKSSNKKAIRNATLVSSNNIDKVLDICYNYIVRNTTVKSKIVEAEIPLVTGKAYEVETEVFGNVTGVLIEQNFALYGGKKVSTETTIR